MLTTDNEARGPLFPVGGDIGSDARHAHGCGYRREILAMGFALTGLPAE
jgi:hypothetical protein